MTSFSLNPQQQAAVDHDGGPLLVIAGAGTGKTRVLTARVARLIQEGVPPWQILAFTFTNRAAREMKERIATAVGPDARKLWVGTFHSTGVRILRREARDHAEAAGWPVAFAIFDREDQESLLREVIRKREIPEGTLRLGQVIARISDAKSALVTPEDALRVAVSPAERRFAECYQDYQRELRRQGALDFDDLIVEVVRLFRANPQRAEHYGTRFRHVLVDEYQDTNHAQFRLVEALGATHRQVFAVGDEDQCLAAGTQVTMGDGSTRAIEEVVPGDWVRSGHGSGVFRPSRVLRVHRRDSLSDGVEIVTRAGRRLVSTPEHTHFTGYLSGISPQTFFTYLMFRRGAGYRVGTTQVYTEGQKQPVLGFRQRLLHEHADALWIVGAHSTEQEARLDEYQLSLRYQLPTLPFVPRRSGRAQRGLVHDPSLLSVIFSEFGVEASARRLLADRGLLLSHPHYRPRSRNSSRRNIVLTLCGDGRGSRPVHRFTIVGNDTPGRLALEEVGLSVRPAKSGSGSWRHETVRARYLQLHEMTERVAAQFPVNVHQMARLGRSRGARETNSLPFTPAGSVLPGMAIFDENGDFDVVGSVRRVVLDGPVFDLDVERTHNFVANGLVTHNSVYGWRGADLRNILEFERAFPGAAVLRLEQNYRSTGRILEAANAVIANNLARKGKTLWCEREEGRALRWIWAADEVEEARRIRGVLAEFVSRGRRLRECAVLYRTHAQSRALEAELRQQGVRYEIVGGVSFYQRREVKDVLAYLRLAVLPTDTVSFWRVWNTPRRGLGDVLRGKLEARIAAGQAAHPPEALRQALGEGSLSRPARAGAEQLLALLAELGERKTDPVDGLVRDVLEQTGYLRELEGLPEHEALERRANVEELVAAAAQFASTASDPGLFAFLSETALLTDLDQLGETEDRVLMLTAHNAKGLEFPLVVIAGLEEGLFPHASSFDDPDELEEERRLFYVALTRAQDEVVLTAAAYRRRWDGASGSVPSRFVNEVPEALLDAEIGSSMRTPELVGATAGSSRRAGTVASGHRGTRFRGREVYHDRFGRGVVVDAEPADGEVKFTVRFGTVLRKVMGRYLTVGGDGD